MAYTSSLYQFHQLYTIPFMIASNLIIITIFLAIE